MDPPRDLQVESPRGHLAIVHARGHVMRQLMVGSPGGHPATWPPVQDACAAGRSLATCPGGGSRPLDLLSPSGPDGSALG